VISRGKVDRSEASPPNGERLAKDSPRQGRSSTTESSLAGRRRRHQLFLDAARLFQEKGYDATSMQDIADAVGILKGSLYHYIGTKEDLLYEIVFEEQAAVIAIVDDLSVLALSPLEKIAEFVRRQIEHNATHLTTTSVYQHDFHSLTGDRRRRVINERDRYEHFLRELISAGQAEGQIRDDVDPKMAGIALLSMMNYIYLWYRPEGEKTAAEISALFIDLVLRGIQAPEVAKRRVKR
jgi:AcrR family transcriptional regulator